MNAIIGMSYLALKTELTPRQRDYIKKIKGSGQHLLGIINDILDISKIEAGKLAVEHTEFELEKVLDTHGCKTIDTDGKLFDPTVHDAMLQQVVPGVPAGTIVGVASKGYRLHDRVVRPAHVIVSKEE